MTVKKHALGLAWAALALAPLLGGCPGVIELKSKIAKAGPGKSTVAPILYDDYEKGVNGAYNYANTDNGAGANCAQSEEDKDVHGGGKALKIAYKSGSGTWGCGVGWGSSYTPKEGYFNAKGTLGIEFWAKAPRGAGFVISLSKKARPMGATKRSTSRRPTQGQGSWKRYFLTYDTFSPRHLFRATRGRQHPGDGVHRFLGGPDLREAGRRRPLPGRHLLQIAFKPNATRQLLSWRVSLCGTSASNLHSRIDHFERQTLHCFYFSAHFIKAFQLYG